MVHQKQIQLGTTRLWVWSLALLSVAVSCGVGRRRGSDPALLWLWYRLAATALIWPLAWEPLYAAECPQKDKKKKTYWKVPAMAQQAWWCLCSTKIQKEQVQSLAGHSGLKNLALPQLPCRWQLQLTQLRCDPWLGNSICCQKRKRREERGGEGKGRGWEGRGGEERRGEGKRKKNRKLTGSSWV